MTPRKPKVGKNEMGWYVSIPRFWGSWDVLEGLESREAAMDWLALNFGFRDAW